MNHVQQPVGIADATRALCARSSRTITSANQILPEHQIPDRVLEPCQAKLVTLIGKELAGALTGVERSS